MRRSLVWVVTAAALSAPAAGAAPRPWTETKADAVLLLKLRLPCASVRSPGECRHTSAGKGFPIRSASCKGGGNDQRSGLFNVFQCRITVYDDGQTGGPVVVSGHLLVTVTGATTFRWQAI